MNNSPYISPDGSCPYICRETWTISLTTDQKNLRPGGKIQFPDRACAMASSRVAITTAVVTGVAALCCCCCWCCCYCCLSFRSHCSFTMMMQLQESLPRQNYLYISISLSIHLSDFFFCQCICCGPFRAGRLAICFVVWRTTAKGGCAEWKNSPEHKRHWTRE